VGENEVVDEALFSVIVCPECEGTLSLCGAGAECQICGKRCAIKNGILCMEESEYYWGEVTQEEMRAATEAAATEGVEKAVDALADKYPFIKDYALGLNRADWRVNLPAHNRGRALDIGSGWGTIPFLLCEDYDEVWSCEYVKERIEWQNVRRAEENRHNLRLVQASLCRLPFKDDSFDLISLNGVLEWMGLADMRDSPRNVQLSVLRECHKKLRRGGCLYIGIENRIGWNIFMGHVDHSGLRFTSLMPRWMASAWLKIAKRDVYRTRRAFASYRTYTYSPPGYTKLLRQAGFDNVEIYWVFPGYNEPLTSGRLSDNRSIIEYIRSKPGRRLRRKLVMGVVKALCHVGFQRLCAPYLLIYSSK